MAMNRRNVLIGLGAVTAGGGALVGTGAFSQVDATREITIGTAADSSAELELSPGDSDIASSSGGEGNELSISASNLNTDATTIYRDVFDISHSEGSARYIEMGSVSLNFGTATFYAYPSANDDISSKVDLSSNYVTLNSGATLTVGLEVQTDDTASSTESTSGATTTIEAAANSSNLDGSDSGETETT